ncbi:MAG: hypothetical protein RID07_11515 [Lacipirellulaceae bacterium]
MGRSRSGRTSKIHGLTDDAGRRRTLLVSPSGFKSIQMDATLLAGIGRLRRQIADRGYDIKLLLQLLAEQGAEMIIPSTSSRKATSPYTAEAYRARNLDERIGAGSKTGATSLPDTISSHGTP